VGIYERHVLPRIIDKLCGASAVDALRRQAIDGLHGRVVEIGFGSGLNVPLYPPEVSEVLAVDPATLGRKLAAERVAASPVPVRYVGLDGQVLPLADDSCDAALSTFTLCTIPDASAALAEVRRVLVPGGRFHFCEHGLAPDEKVRRTQRRVEPINRRLAGGCHLTRDIRALIEGAGFTIERCESMYGEGPKPYSYHSIGVAIAA
jgi:ubiquinone/menaquinone biosynthesis C-methylase UbiE